MYVEDKRIAEPPVVESEARKVLLAAVELLSRPGVWVNRFPEEGGGKHCVLTALHTCAMSSGVSNMVYVRLVQLLDYRAGRWVANWNDSPNRRLDEVLTLLRGTAELV